MDTGDPFRNGTTDRAGAWQLDPVSADIRFSARGLWGLLPVSGSFGQATGSIVWHPDGTAVVLVAVRADSVTTGMAMRDRHLCGREFLDTRNHPVILFHGRVIDQRRMRLEVQGLLTVRDTTAEMQLDVSLTREGPGLVAATAVRIDLSAYGIGPRFGVVRPDVALVVRGRLHPARTPPPTPLTMPPIRTDGVRDLGAK